MATRVVRDGMLTSERIDALTPLAELFYRRVQQIADDHGRYFANPKLIRSAAFPLRTDTTALADIESWMAECESAGLVTLYDAKGTKYLEILDFGQRVQSKSKFPDPPESTVTHGDSPESTALVVVEDVVEVGVGDVPRKRGKPRKHPMPDGFALSERVKRWAAEKGHGRLPERFEHFVGAARARGYEYADWDEALMNAIRDDWAKLGTNAASKPGGGRRPL